MKLTDLRKPIVEAREYPGLDAEQSAQVEELTTKIRGELENLLRGSLKGVDSKVKNWVLDNLDGSTILDYYN